jgi:nitrogen fixation protein FixH
MIATLRRAQDALRRNSRWIPAIFFAMFAVIILVNGIMIYLALDSFTGLQTRNHYREGLAYNQQLEAQQRQEALGWRVETALLEQQGQSGRLRLSVSGPDGSALSIDQARLRFIRPGDPDLDFMQALPVSGRGPYDAEIAWPAPGAWDMKLTLFRGAERYQLNRRLVIE